MYLLYIAVVLVEHSHGDDHKAGPTQIPGYGSPRSGPAGKAMAEKLFIPKNRKPARADLFKVE